MGSQKEGEKEIRLNIKYRGSERSFTVIMFHIDIREGQLRYQEHAQTEFIIVPLEDVEWWHAGYDVFRSYKVPKVNNRGGSKRTKGRHSDDTQQNYT